MEAPPRISAELRVFLESGLSIVAAVRDEDLVPDGAAAWAAKVRDDGARLTVFFYEDAGREMLARLESHPEIALDFDLPTTHRACQVKGTYVSSRRARPAERSLVEKQIEAFVADLEAMGIPRTMTAGWKLWPCLAIDVQVTHLFEQTPGPGTGGPLR